MYMQINALKWDILQIVQKYKDFKVNQPTASSLCFLLHTKFRVQIKFCFILFLLGLCKNKGCH